MHTFLETVKNLHLPAGEFAIFGSGPLLVRGIIDQVNDIDVICRGAAWQQAREIGELVYLDEYDAHVVHINAGQVSLGRSWGIGNFDVNALIDNAELIRGLPFVRLNHVIDYKQIARRPKDLAHLELLRMGGYL